MSTRRTQSMPPTTYDKVPKERSRCIAAICVSWKVFTCIFSHVMLVALVVAYCIAGAFTFNHFEAGNEIQVSARYSFYLFIQFSMIIADIRCSRFDFLFFYKRLNSQNKYDTVCLRRR